jgi:dihydroflavonol-4-reductase
MSEVEGDLGDLDSLRSACKGMDGVFHTAGLISYNPAKAPLLQAVNVEGTRSLLRAAQEMGVARFLVTSSTASIGVNENPDLLLTERAPFNAGDLGLAYFPTKKAAEDLVLAANGPRFEALSVNPGSLLGPGDTRRYEKGYAGLVYKYGPPCLFYGGINFVDVDDVVEGHWLAWKKGRAGERYILGGENLTYADFILRMNGILGRKSPSWYLPKSFMGMAAGALRLLNFMGVDLHMSPELIQQTCRWYLFVSSEKARTELGYKPGAVDRSLVETIRWLKDLGRLT